MRPMRPRLDSMLKLTLALSCVCALGASVTACKSEETPPPASPPPPPPPPPPGFQQAPQPTDPAAQPGAAAPQTAAPTDPAAAPPPTAAPPPAAPATTAPPPTAAPPPAAAAPAATLSKPADIALVCQQDSQCITHKCNLQYGKCAWPCQTDNDCQPGNYCVAPQCLPKVAQPQ